jgi:hypothetical protein
MWCSVVCSGPPTWPQPAAAAPGPRRNVRPPDRGERQALARRRFRQSARPNGPVGVARRSGPARSRNIVAPTPWPGCRGGPGNGHQHIDSFPPAIASLMTVAGVPSAQMSATNAVIGGCARAVWCKLASRRPTPRTCAPAWAKAIAVARPIPDPGYRILLGDDHYPDGEVMVGSFMPNLSL